MDINILVVDDSEIMRTVIERTFNICGYDSTSIFQACNGKEGLEIIDEHAIDLLLVDINMPIMDGVQMLDQVKKNSSNNDLSIVIVSAESNQDTQAIYARKINGRAGPAYLNKEKTSLS